MIDVTYLREEEILKAMPQEGQETIIGILQILYRDTELIETNMKMMEDMY